MTANRPAGQEVAKRILLNQLRAGQLSHAYLFTGSAEADKKQAALFLAQAANCGADNRPCGSCPACRQIELGVHPDVRWIVPDGASIKLQQVKSILAEAVLTPNRGPYRVFVIEGAELLTREAANALLLILEEPPSFDLFILTASGPVLSTIESRCQLLRFVPTASSQMGNTRADAESEAERFLMELGRAPLYQRTKLLDKLLEQAEMDLPAFLTELLCLYRDFAVWQFTQESQLVRNEKAVKLLYPAIAERQPNLLAATQAILDVQRRLQNNVNKRLALEYLLYSL